MTWRGYLVFLIAAVAMLAYLVAVLVHLALGALPQAL